MLPRALLFLVATSLVAGAAVAYNNDRYPDYTRDQNRFGNNQNYNPNNPTYNQGSNYPGSTYNQGSNYPDYRDQGNNGNYNTNRNSQYPRVYAKNETAIFCYVNGSRIQHGLGSYQSEEQFNSDHIDVNSCTHIIFAAAVINENKRQISSLSPDFLSSTSALKMQKHNLKVLVSISGRPSLFSEMARNPSDRALFISSVESFLNEHKLDGVNIDWQWPNALGRRSDDKEHYATVLKDLKIKLRHEGKIVSVFVPPERQQIADSFDNFIRDELMQTVDYFILMALEMRGHNYQKIEHHAPVDTYQSGQTVRGAIDYIRGQVNPDNYYKFILAIPFYGKRYQLENRLSYPDESPLNKPFLKIQPNYQEPLISSYKEACRYLGDRNYRYGYDTRNECPYLVHDTTIILYEDAQSVRAKTRLAMLNGFGGVMAYSIEMDDYSGVCQNSGNNRATNDRNTYNSYSSSSYGSQYNYDRKYPLLHAIYDQVQRGSAVTFQSSPLAIAFAVVCAGILKVNN